MSMKSTVNRNTFLVYKWAVNVGQHSVSCCWLAVAYLDSEQSAFEYQMRENCNVFFDVLHWNEQFSPKIWTDQIQFATPIKIVSGRMEIKLCHILHKLSTIHTRQTKSNYNNSITTNENMKPTNQLCWSKLNGEKKFNNLEISGKNINTLDCWYKSNRNDDYYYIV